MKKEPRRTLKETDLAGWGDTVPIFTTREFTDKAPHKSIKEKWTKDILGETLVGNKHEKIIVHFNTNPRSFTFKIPVNSHLFLADWESLQLLFGTGANTGPQAWV